MTLATELLELNETQIAVVRDFAERSDQYNRDGNYSNKISENNISPKALGILLRHAVVHQSGWYLSGAVCYSMDMGKIKKLRSALRAAR